MSFSQEASSPSPFTAGRSSLAQFINSSFRKTEPPDASSVEPPSPVPAGEDTTVIDVLDNADLTSPLLDDDAYACFPDEDEGQTTASVSPGLRLQPSGSLPVDKPKFATVSRMQSNVSSTGGALPSPTPHVEAAAGKDNAFVKSMMFGVVNSVVTIPVLLSFAAIIFQHPSYKPVMAELVKLMFLASALHQAVFVVMSSLTFAVGQVQDVGMIFLSAMATDIAVHGRAAGEELARTVTTTLFTLTLSTTIVGLLVIATGYLKLATLVQYVPLPVVGGYLGYVGYFCLVAGLSLATGLQVASPVSWLQMLSSSEALLKLAPAVATWLLLMLVPRRVRSPLALPATLVAVPLLFYAVLYGCGWTLQDARDAGWVTQAEGRSVAFWEVWRLYDFGGGISWRVMPAQVGKMLALFFVVAFGSSMDVAAIQQDTPQQLDYNHELVTVGVSNLVTGLAGCGFTGSYIFSQTVFSHRAGVTHRVNGCMVSVLETALFLLPFSVMEFIPNFYFGGLMVWIGVDIAKDWLVLSYLKVRSVEFGLLWATFLLISGFGLEAGICLGIVMACMLFTWEYAKVHVHAFSVLPSRSGSVRTFEERSLLEVFAQRTTAVSLDGYIFFGSSIRIAEKVKQVARLLLQSDAKVPRMGATGRLPSSLDLAAMQLANLPVVQRTASLLQEPMRKQTTAAYAAAPRYMIITFRRVNGLDATAAQTFSGLARTLSSMGIELIVTHVPHMRPEVLRLLQAHGVVSPPDNPSAGFCRYFDSMEAGLQHCEEQLLKYARSAGLLAPPPESMDLPSLLRAHTEQPQLKLPAALEYSHEQLAEELSRYIVAHEYGAGEVLFNMGDQSDTLFLLQSGQVVCQFFSSSMRLHRPFQDNAEGMQMQERSREFSFGPGGIMGDMDFVLQRPRSFRAVAASQSKVTCLHRSAYEDMAVHSPALLTVIQAIVLRSACMSLSHTVEVLELADT